jgi:O-antigen ligase
MLLAGLLIGADAQARRALAAAVILIALAVGASVGWGLLTDRVVLGGEVGADPELLRVQYQLAGLAIATAGGLAAVQVAGARGWAKLPWLLLLGLLGAAVMLPGGRAALLALALAVVLLPAWRFWLGGRPQAALGWVALAAWGAVALFTVLALEFSLLDRLRALDRLLEGAVSETRPAMWADALRLSGWGGIGPGAYPQAAGFGDDRGMNPHNHALEALVEAGAPGLLLWSLAFGGAMILLVMRGGRVAPGRAAVILALVLPMAVTVMVSTDLSNRMAWFALGLALSVGVERVRVV